MATDSREALGQALENLSGSLERTGGRIWAESRPGQGSTCSFTIPRRTAQVAP